MSDEYTPTDEQVRGHFAASPMAPSPREFAREAFDRWLAERDARIRAEVIDWIEGLDGHGFLNRLLANDARAHFGLTEGADRG